MLCACGGKDASTPTETTNSSAQDRTNYVDLTIDGVDYGRYGTVGDAVSKGPNGDDRKGGFAGDLKAGVAGSSGGILLRSSFVDDATKTEGIFFALFVNGISGIGTYTSIEPLRDASAGYGYVNIRKGTGPFNAIINFSYYVGLDSVSRTGAPGTSCRITAQLPTAGFRVDVTQWGGRKGEFTKGTFRGTFYDNVTAEKVCSNSISKSFSGSFVYAAR